MTTLRGRLFDSRLGGWAPDAHDPGQPLVGLCLSGGGTRAASCSMGALRELQRLGLLKRVQCLSTVSGGGWAGSLYVYSPHPLDETLGPSVPRDAIERLRWGSGDAAFDLSVLGEHAIGKFCTRMGWEALTAGSIEMHQTYGEVLSAHALWPRLIGRLVLEPYGLGDHPDDSGRPTRYYTASRELFPLIGARNPELQESDFYFANEARPWWLANSTFNAPGEHPVPFPFWQTELDVGIYPRFGTQGIGGTDLGGGGIEPFTMGTQAPLSVDPSTGTFLAATPAGRFALSDAVGTSSAALGVELFANLPSWVRSIVETLTPEYPYWPVMNPSQPAQRYQLSDGGELDNCAICGLLGWAPVQRILSILSTYVPIEVDASRPPGDVNAVRMDDSASALFGWIWGTGDGENRYRRVQPSDGNLWAVQAFDPDDFAPFVEDLRQTVHSGGAACARVTAHTVGNAHFGIQAGRTIELLMVFNHRAPSFWDQLEWEIRAALDVHYPLVTFPYFSTIRDLALGPQAVNLLANLMAWSLQTNEDRVRALFQPSA